MNILARTPAMAPRRAKTASRIVACRYTVVVREDDLAEALEDARLNAIADERAKGPFVRVSLDDL